MPMQISMIKKLILMVRCFCYKNKIYLFLINTCVYFSGEVINSNSLIIAIFEFVQTIVDRKRFTNLLDNMLPEVIYYLIVFMQITVDQIQQWTTNPNQFVEEDETFEYNVRISAQEFLAVNRNITNNKKNGWKAS